MAATIVGAPNIAAIPAVTPINKPQEILPVKKPIPIEMIAKAAKALPPEPVMIFKALQRVSTNALSSPLALTVKVQPATALQRDPTKDAQVAVTVPVQEPDVLEQPVTDSQTIDGGRLLHAAVLGVPEHIPEV
jgi:hypothetical protein